MNSRVPNDQSKETLSRTPTSQERKKRTPKDYAAAVSEHSALTKEESLYPGIIYRPLALFLQSGGTALYATRRSTLPRAKVRSHNFVTLHDLSCEHDDPNRVTTFDSLTGLTEFAEHPLPQGDSGHLLFLRGYPSNKWLKLIGVRYQTDPEIFRRHLNTRHKQDFYDLPGVPSSSHNILRLSVTSIGKRYGTTLGREDGEQALATYFRELGTDPSIIGESLVRNFSVYDDEHFSIEQNISICVVRCGLGWLGLILLDNGRDLDEGPAGPWLNPCLQHASSDSGFYPVIRLKPRICFKEQEKLRVEIGPQQGHSAAKRRFMQSGSLLCSNRYGYFLSASLMREDPFYAMHDLFAFTVCAENQFLNLLKAKLDAEALNQDDENYMQQSLRNLRYNKAILHGHIEQLQNTISCIHRRGSPRWPRATAQNNHGRKLSSHSSIKIADEPSLSRVLSIPASIRSTDERTSQLGAASKDDPAQQAPAALADAAAASLLEDYEALLHRANSLSQLYSEGIDDIRTSAMLVESRKAIAQAEGVARLTLLAFFFLPLSFTTSFFGMNFKELGDQLSIWIWVVVSVPVFGFSVILCFWRELSKTLRRLQKSRADV